MGNVVIQDPNGHLIDVVKYRRLGNEDCEAWEKLLGEGLCDNVPDVDRDGITIITDGDKGATAAMDDAFVNVTHFFDYYHKMKIMNKRF